MTNREFVTQSPDSNTDDYVPISVSLDEIDACIARQQSRNAFDPETDQARTLADLYEVNTDVEPLPGVPRNELLPFVKRALTMACTSQRNADVLDRYFGLTSGTELTFAEISESGEFDVSRVRVADIVKKSLLKLQHPDNIHKYPELRTYYAKHLDNSPLYTPELPRVMADGIFVDEPEVRLPSDIHPQWLDHPPTLEEYRAANKKPNRK